MNAKVSPTVKTGVSSAMRRPITSDTNTLVAPSTSANKSWKTLNAISVPPGVRQTADHMAATMPPADLGRSLELVKAHSLRCTTPSRRTILTITTDVEQDARWARKQNQKFAYLRHTTPLSEFVRTDQTRRQDIRKKDLREL